LQSHEYGYCIIRSGIGVDEETSSVHNPRSPISMARRRSYVAGQDKGKGSARRSAAEQRQRHVNTQKVV
jgi:hypothetical protein